MENNIEFSLKKNKLDLEHQVLLQNRSAIWVVESAFPFSVLAIVVSEGLYVLPTALPILVVSCFFMAILEDLRRKISKAIREKQLEVDQLANLVAP